MAIEDGWSERHEWDPDQGDNPTCLGNCGERSNGWTRDYLTGYDVCAKCRRPSPYNLVCCRYCEIVYLPELAIMLAKMKTSNRELNHPECEESFS